MSTVVHLATEREARKRQVVNYSARDPFISEIEDDGGDHEATDTSCEYCGGIKNDSGVGCRWFSDNPEDAMTGYDAPCVAFRSRAANGAMGVIFVSCMAITIIASFVFAGWIGLMIGGRE